MLLAALTASVMLGVACPQANVVACDRVGVAVFVHGGASSVHAVVAGRDVVLRRSWHDARGTAWTGRLRDAGLRRPGPLRIPADPRGRWFGADAPDVRVRVTVVRLAGTTQRATRVVSLRPGWG